MTPNEARKLGPSTEIPHTSCKNPVMKDIAGQFIAVAFVLATIGVGECVLVPVGGSMGQAASSGVLVPASGSSYGVVAQEVVMPATVNVVPVAVQPVATAVVLQQPVAVAPASQVVVVPAGQPAASPAMQAAAPVEARSAEATAIGSDSDSSNSD